MRFARTMLMAGAMLGMTSSAFAGPIILGGDDLNEHGNAVGGVNLLGWQYIERALDAMEAQVTLTPPGGFTVDIVELGEPTGGDPALNSAAAALGLTTVGYSGAAGINQFFADLASGAVRPKIIYSPGNDYGQASIDAAESGALAANAAAIEAFVAAGGGLFSHGGANTTVYSYLTALLPGIVMSTACNQPVTLTATGAASFPTLTNADVNAGPCHGTFSGNLGGLQILAVDALQRAMIIGGVGGSIVTPPPPAPEPASLLLFGAALAGFGVRRRMNRQ